MGNIQFSYKLRKFFIGSIWFNLTIYFPAHLYLISQFHFVMILPFLVYLGFVILVEIYKER